MSGEIKEGILVDLSDFSEVDADFPLNLGPSYSIDSVQARSRLSSILSSGAKRPEDEDDPWGLLSTPKPKKQPRNIVNTGLLVSIDSPDLKAADDQQRPSFDWSSSLSSIPPAASSRKSHFSPLLDSDFSSDVFQSYQSPCSILDNNLEDPDWRRLESDAEAVASVVKMSKSKPKSLDLTNYSPINGSPLLSDKDFFATESLLGNSPIKALDFETSDDVLMNNKPQDDIKDVFNLKSLLDTSNDGPKFGDDEDEKIFKKVSPVIEHKEENVDEENQDPKAVYIDDQLEKAIVSLTVTPRKPLASTENKKKRLFAAHKGVPLPPIKPALKPINHRRSVASTPLSKATVLPSKPSLSNQSCPKITRRSLLPSQGPITPRPSSISKPRTPLIATTKQFPHQATPIPTPKVSRIAQGSLPAPRPRNTTPSAVTRATTTPSTTPRPALGTTPRVTPGIRGSMQRHTARASQETKNQPITPVIPRATPRANHLNSSTVTPKINPSSSRIARRSFVPTPSKTAVQKSSNIPTTPGLRPSTLPRKK